MRGLLLGISAIGGRGAMQLILQQARLPRYLGQAPAHNYQAEVRAADYEAVLAALARYYGRGTRGTLLRVGRAAFQQLLVDRPVRTRLYRVYCRLLPGRPRMAFIARWMAVEMTTPSCRLTVASDSGRLVITGVFEPHLLSADAIGWASALMLGQVQGALLWAMGAECEVAETAQPAADAPGFQLEVRGPRH